MKKIALLIIFSLVNNYAYAEIIENHYKEGLIEIQKGKSDTPKIVIGDKVIFKIDAYQTVFFDNTVIDSNPFIHNSTEQKVKAIYAISFYDKDSKLVICNQGNLNIEPGDSMLSVSGTVYIPEELVETITSYKLRTIVIETK